MPSVRHDPHHDPNKPKNSSTCTHCRLRRVRCNREKPCSTCIARGIADQCDSPVQPSAPYLQRGGDAAGLRHEIDRIQRLSAVLQGLQPNQRHYLHAAKHSRVGGHRKAGSWDAASYPTPSQAMATSFANGPGSNPSARRSSDPPTSHSVPFASAPHSAPLVSYGSTTNNSATSSRHVSPVLPSSGSFGASPTFAGSFGNQQISAFNGGAFYPDQHQPPQFTNSPRSSRSSSHDSSTSPLGSELGLSDLSSLASSYPSSVSSGVATPAIYSSLGVPPSSAALGTTNTPYETFNAATAIDGAALAAALNLQGQLEAEKVFRHHHQQPSIHQPEFSQHQLAQWNVTMADPVLSLAAWS